MYVAINQGVSPIQKRRPCFLVQQIGNQDGQLSMASFELPNLRKLFAASRSEQEESAYSRTAFYNLLFFVTSIAAFSFAAQRLAPAKNMGR
ncbi:hypothetical protein DFP73DRAFT_374200 [Morchella snyderi]|nr:hypothetical protein DFP73DRAFT_374200 [Morchella snyderi]